MPEEDSRLVSTHPLSERISGILIPQDIIHRRVRAMAAQLQHDFCGFGVVHVIPILKGAFVFATDLVREMSRFGAIDVRIDFYEAETYGRDIKQSGEGKREVRIKRRPEPVGDGPVLLMDDIADTVQTISAIRRDMIETMGIEADRVDLCFLLDKVLQNPPAAVKHLKDQLIPDHVGFRIPDVWVAGYGIDAGEDFRSLPVIIQVDETFYQ